MPKSYMRCASAKSRRGKKAISGVRGGGLCDWFARFLPPDAKVVVDVAAGYCDFINNIRFGGTKVALDVNPDVQTHAASGVKAVVGGIERLPDLFEQGTVSVFFMSNFLEHITKEEIKRLLEDCLELLEEGGQVWILTPNIRYTGGKYWDFFDHITPITEKALCEIAVATGFSVKKCVRRFLPFTTKSALPKAAWLVRLYLKLMPFSGMVFGEQSFIILQKA